MELNDIKIILIFVKCQLLVGLFVQVVPSRISFYVESPTVSAVFLGRRPNEKWRAAPASS